MDIWTPKWRVSSWFPLKTERAPQTKHSLRCGGGDDPYSASCNPCDRGHDRPGMEPPAFSGEVFGRLG